MTKTLLGFAALTLLMLSACSRNSEIRHCAANEYDSFQKVDTTIKAWLVEKSSLIKSRAAHQVCSEHINTYSASQCQTNKNDEVVVTYDLTNSCTTINNNRAKLESRSEDFAKATSALEAASKEDPKLEETAEASNLCGIYFSRYENTNFVAPDDEGKLVELDVKGLKETCEEISVKLETPPVK